MDYVIVGDAGEALTYTSLNTTFRLLMEGAEFITLEKDRYWMAQDGLSLSAGHGKTFRILLFPGA